MTSMISNAIGLLAYAARACPCCPHRASHLAGSLHIYLGHNRRSQLGRETLADVLGLLRFMRKDTVIALQCIASQHLRHRPAHHNLSHACGCPFGTLSFGISAMQPPPGGFWQSMTAHLYAFLRYPQASPGFIHPCRSFTFAASLCTCKEQHCMRTGCRPCGEDSGVTRSRYHINEE